MSSLSISAVNFDTFTGVGKYINGIKYITIILPMMKSAFMTAKATNAVMRICKIRQLRVLLEIYEIMRNVYKITLRELMS